MPRTIVGPICLGLALLIGGACTCIVSLATYRAAYVFRITELHVVADGIRWSPWVVGTSSAVLLVVLLALRHQRQLTDKGLYISLGVVLLAWGLSLALYVNWCAAVQGVFFRYKVIVDNPTGSRLLDELGPLRHGSAEGARGVYAFPIDHARVIRAYERLAAQGYRVRYEDPEFIEGLVDRYVRPYETEPAEQVGPASPDD